MFNISSYLDKFRKAGMAELLAKEAFIKAVASATGAALSKGDVEIKAEVARVKAHPLIKAQLQIKKAAILAAFELSPEAAHKKIRDIR